MRHRLRGRRPEELKETALSADGSASSGAPAAQVPHVDLIPDQCQAVMALTWQAPDARAAEGRVAFHRGGRAQGRHRRGQHDHSGPTS